MAGAALEGQGAGRVESAPLGTCRLSSEGSALHSQGQLLVLPMSLLAPFLLHQRHSRPLAKGTRFCVAESRLACLTLILPLAAQQLL